MAARITTGRVLAAGAVLLAAAAVALFIVWPSSSDCGCNVDSATSVVLHAGLGPGITPGPAAATLPGRAR